MSRNDHFELRLFLSLTAFICALISICRWCCKSKKRDAPVKRSRDSYQTVPTNNAMAPIQNSSLTPVYYVQANSGTPGYYVVANPPPFSTQTANMPSSAHVTPSATPTVVPDATTVVEITPPSNNQVVESKKESATKEL